MTHKLKLLLFAMAVIASFCIWQIYNSFSFDASPQQASVQEIPAIFTTDEDHDGLTDAEESLWNTDFQKEDSDGDGFLDGEEVVSGHDPTVQGPDDIISGAQNVTKKISELVVAGLSEGSLKPDNKNFEQSVTMLTDEVLRQYSLNAVLEPIALKTVPESSANLAQYRKGMQPLLRDIIVNVPAGFERLFAAAQATANGNPEAYTEFFDTESGHLDTYIKKLRDVDVPLTWQDQHLSVIQYLQSIRSKYMLLKDGDDDPIQALIAYADLTSLLLRQVYIPIEPYQKLFK